MPEMTASRQDAEQQEDQRDDSQQGRDDVAEATSEKRKQSYGRVAAWRRRREALQYAHVSLGIGLGRGGQCLILFRKFLLPRRGEEHDAVTISSITSPATGVGPDVLDVLCVISSWAGLQARGSTAIGQHRLVVVEEPHRRFYQS